MVNSHLELSLRSFLELVLANNTEIAIQKLSIESPKNSITSALAQYDPSVTASFRSSRSTGTTTDVVFNDNGSFTVGLRVTDEFGESDIDTSVVTVNNVAPAVTANPVGQTIQYSDYIADVTVTVIF